MFGRHFGFNQPKVVEEPSALGRVRFEGAIIDASRHDGARSVLAYYESKRSGDGTVRRTAIQAKDLLPLLPYLFLAELAGDDWRFRLFGTALVDRFGAELTGKSLRYVLDPSVADGLGPLWSSIAQSHQPQSRQGCFVTPMGARLAYETLICPVLGRDGRSIQIFGGKFFLA